MLKQSKLRTQRQQNGIFIFSMFFLLSTLTLLVNYIDSQLKLGVTKYIDSLFIGVTIILFFIQLVIWLIRNKAYKGIKYAIYHYLIVLKLRKAFLDVNYFNKRVYLNNEIADLPEIKLEFSDDFSEGKLLIENIRINKSLDDINVSFGLMDYIVERQYLSDNENYHVFELYDSNIDQQLIFNSIDELLEFSSQPCFL